MPYLPRDQESASDAHALQVFEERHRAFRILFDTVWEVEGKSDDEVPLILCRNLLKICRAAYAVLGYLDQETGTLHMCARCDQSQEPKPLTTIPCLPLDAATLELFSDTQIQQVDCGRKTLDDLFSTDGTPIFPPCKGCQCHRISCIRENELLAIGFVLLPPRQSLRLKDLVDTYLTMAGMVIQRINNVRTISNARDALEKRVQERTLEMEKANRELKQEVLERKIAENKFRSIFDNAQEGIFQSTPNGGLIAANSAMAKILGYDSPEELIRTLTDLGTQLYRSQESRARIHRQLKQHGVVTSFIDEFKCKDGSTIWGSMSAHAVLYDDGTLNYMEGSFLDVSKNIAAEKALKEAMEAAEAANKMKSDFLALVSHELRTPLTSILGFTKMIHKRLNQSVFPKLHDTDPQSRRIINQVQDNFSIIIAEGERLAELINNVLDLSRLEAGRFNWNWSLIDMPHILEQALATSAILIRQKGLALSQRIAPDLPTIPGDPDRILQVCINLLSNAVKFTEHGAITCSATYSDHAIEVCFTDTGIGMDPRMHHDIFDKFKQLSDTLTDKPTGSGLGLAICKEIIEHHQGRIWVESTPGKGSTFCFTLPVDVPLPNASP